MPGIYCHKDAGTATPTATETATEGAKDSQKTRTADGCVNQRNALHKHL